MKKEETILEVTILLIIYLFLLSFFDLKLILSNTTTSGGDTPSHHYIAFYLKNYLLPKFKIYGWSPDWYAGFPILTFYFPLPYLLIVFLSYLLPFTISFKIVTLLGIFLLPVFILISLKTMKFEFPIPILASILSLYFLFSESYTFYGGNIASTLAGEFPYSISLSFLVLLIGFLYEGIKKNKNLIKNSLLLSLTTFSHLYTISVFVPSTVFFLRKNLKKNLKYLFLFYFFGFSLVAFWLLPFVLKHEYTSSLGWVQNRELKNLCLYPFNYFLPFSLMGTVIAIIKKDERIFYFLSLIIISLLYFFLLPNGFLFNCRYLPFYYLFMLFIAAYGIGKIVNILKKNFSYFFLLFLLAFSLIYIKNSLNFVPFWIKWNYEGFESKERWNTVNSLFEYLKTLPYGRIMHEYSPSHDVFGSPRTLESIPYFSGKPVMEGLLIESSLAAPYHFWMQAQLSSKPSCPISYVGCSSLNISKGLKYLRLFGVKYFIASSEEVKREIKKYDDFILLKRIDEFEVYEIKNSGNYAEIPKFQPVFVSKKNWKEISLEWFKDDNLVEIPLIFSEKGEIIDLKEIKRIPIEKNCTLEEKIENEEIKIRTNCVKTPIWIKIPYFPNWKVEGAERIYLASPCFMVIFPEKENVKIYYGHDAIDLIGILLSLGVIVLLFLKTGKLKF
jgi:uncharacterized membrane protein